MTTWNKLYRENGQIQLEVSKEAIVATKLFQDESVEKVLDLGCGTGRNTRYFYELGFEVYGTDTSSEAIAIAKKNLVDVSFKECIVGQLPYDSSMYDAVFSNHVLQHGKIEDITETISEISRITKEED